MEDPNHSSTESREQTLVAASNNAAQMSPKIVILGSTKALQRKNMVDHIIKRAGGSSIPNVLYLGSRDTLSENEHDKSKTKDFELCTSNFFLRNCRVKFHDFSPQPDNNEIPDGELRQLVENWANIIICSWNEKNKIVRVHQLLKDACIRRDAVLCGNSSVMGGIFRFRNDSDDTTNTSDQSVDLSENDADWRCIPQDTAISTIKKAPKILNKQTKVVGIDNLAALVATGNHAMAVSGDKLSTCHILTMDETNGTTSTPLPFNWEEPIPMDELMEFHTPATASHLNSLEEHVDTDFVIADDIIAQETVPNETVVNYEEKNAESSAVPKIVAAGRMKALQMQPIVDKILELSESNLPKLLYIGTASFDRTDKFLMCTKAFREMGCNVRRLDVSEDDTVPPLEEMREMVVEWPEVILCSGGNTLHALIRWKEVGLDLLMKEAGLKGKVMIL